MNILTVLDVAKAVQELDEVIGVSRVSDKPSVLLQEEAFLETFQTYEKDRLVSDNGYLLTAVFCGVEFQAVLHD